MAQVTLSNVKKIYAGGVEAVKGVSFDIPDGGFCVLVGPSGCGKSTLLRMVAGLETISAGEVAIGSRVVNQVEPADRDIAMVFQNYALYPHMSVYDNMAYGLRNRGTPKDEIEKRVAEAARILAIEPFLQRRPRQLSGGQRQRVAMGRAIVRKPQVFLFDEPLSNLDAKLRVQMRVEIKKLQRALGVTAIYVTHDQVEAMTLSDKLVVMNGGQVEQIGLPADVYRKPASRFVATFIGSPPMNLLPAKLDGHGIIALGDALLQARDLREDLPAGTAVEVGLRPEDIEIASEGAVGSLPFDVEFIEELGATQLFHGQLAGKPFVMQAATGEVAAQAGRLWISVDPDKVHVFDAQSGVRLGKA
ncbi:sn-glycerol-3-phosphate import ATP-binding protein UgpC [Bosea sp. (in: a-proteobacteria)]|jgi:sn-glycerol 3-phosphate transport system ATP-binding protein|uniref:sn-glycerol-3-phosphate import ATP-binding protein UgpC n=1 Tax=Bosea sp. (in: a-proteobacteria) TaxID=1871050 RepID=UPI002DDD6DBD|nr:sn-glycerol-3-phosphate import ATP-binding protein UgpC [Bosea sp. (in: a-proteobacteria)]HEV2512413.1 sn-glycerol-3-phosphate import ATP-binding protein UgpC [Bosea sp. (in: a-proteobacteria)]